jgi:pyrroline-5-carboxylate reductase
MRTIVAIVGRGCTDSALFKGWLRAPGPHLEVLVCDGRQGGTTDSSGAEGITLGVSLDEAARRAAVVIVEADAAETRAVLESLRPSLVPGRPLTIVSLAPDVTLVDLRAGVGPGPELFRAIVGAGAEWGEGVIVLCPEPGTAEAATGSVTLMFAGVGLVEVLPENLLGAAGAVMDSSAGFLALALEGIETGARNAGLPRGTARALVRQTALATALLLRSHAGTPAELKDQVASPGGTTIAGLAVLEGQAVRGAFIQALEEAAREGRRA